MSSLPRFFLQASSSSSSTPTYRQIFRKFLQPLYLHHWVCTWIFNNIMTSPFHKDHILSMDYFHQMVLLQGDSRFQTDYVNSVLHIQCEGHIAFIPVYYQNQITVGYGICFNSDAAGQFDCGASGRLPFSSPFVCRFVLDHTSHDFMLFIPSVMKDVISIMAFSVVNRIHYTFIIPAQEYSWNCLPDDPLATLKGIALSPNFHPTSFPTYEHNKIVHVNNIDLTPEDVQELISKLSIVSAPSSSSSLTNNNNQLTNTVTTNPNTVVYLSSHPINTKETYPTIAFPDHVDTQTISPISEQQKLESQKEMISIFDKLIYSFGERDDNNPYQIPGYMGLTMVRNLHHKLVLPDAVIINAVLPKCTHVYYSTVLSVTTDAPLMAKPKVDPSKKVLLPNPVIRTNQSTISAESKNKNRSLILEERRRRNRLSAARSNAKKQQKIEEMEEELKSSKVLVEELRKRYELTLQQNQKLKLLINETKNTRRSTNYS